MKISILSAGFALLLAVPFAYGESTGAQTYDPCFNVNIQNDRINRSSVRQNCDRNINRTVQAGEQNWAETFQTGEINDNKVRQYHYDRSKYFGRIREK